MLLRLLLLHTLLCTSALVRAQTGPPTWFTTYNPHVLEAEAALLRRNPNTALECYARAFAVHAHPHNVDLYNAALAARAADRPDLLRAYLLQLVRQGVPVAFVEDHFDRLYYPLVDWTVLYRELLEEQHRFERQLDVARADCYAAVEYRSLVVRTADPPPPVREEQDSLNMQGLQKCIATYGFPSPWQLGQADPLAEDYLYLRPLQQELVRVNQTGEDRFGFLPLVDSLARRGTLDTYTYLNLLLTQQSWPDAPGGYGDDPLLTVTDGDGALYRIVLSPEARQHFNTNRKALGLRSFDEETALRIRYLTGDLDELPYHLPRQRTLTKYPLEIADGLPLEPVGTVLSDRY